MPTKDDYIQMQKSFYEAETPRMSIVNHRHHDANPDYWDILLAPILTEDWSDRVALDFGCGCGRNVMNMLDKSNVLEAHGCDISSSNIEYCKNFLKTNGYLNFDFFVTNGDDLGSAKDNYYGFIMSTIVLQHICVYSIRRSILEHMYRALAPEGILSIQMGFGANGHPTTAGYYEDAVHAMATNSGYDVRVTDEEELAGDLREIGFKNIETVVRPSFSDGHQFWIFAKGAK